MNNRGYASTIRRNSRKRGKASLWRHALRMYDKMKAEESEQQHLINIKERHPSTATVLRITEHFEAASVACSKLGLWREALGIYHEVDEIETNGNRKDVTVTENLILSLVGSCVRASRMRRKQKFSEAEQREPLDAVKEILKGLRQNHGLDLKSRHVNPLAAAYQHLGLTVESSNVVESFLLDQEIVAYVRHGDDDGASVAIADTGAKDKASYNIMVQSAIMDGNWTTAIDSLRNMTNAGLYPNSRNLNLWSETAKKRELRGGGRRMRSWKKKRERMLVRGTLPPTVPGKENSENSNVATVSLPPTVPGNENSVNSNVATVDFPVWPLEQLQAVAINEGYDPTQMSRSELERVVKWVQSQQLRPYSSPGP